MKASEISPVQDMSQTLSNRYANLIERYFGLLVALVSVGVVLMFFRMLEQGWNDARAMRLGLACLLWVILVLRRRLPSLLVMGGIFFCAFTFVVLGAATFGFIDPALYLFLSLPIVTAVIWGLRPGLLTLGFAMTLLGLLAVKFLYIQPEVPFDANAFLLEPSNWVLFLVSISVNTLWCILIVNMQRGFWISSMDELQRENERRLESERQRSAARVRWHSVAENIPGTLFDYVRLADGNHAFENISTGCRELWGVSPDAIYRDASALLDKIPQASRLRIREAISASADSMAPFSVRYESRLDSGDVKWVQMTGRPSVDPEGVIRWHCVALDVTREVKAEEEAKRQAELAQQAQRQKSIGQLTGGVAHDFNNLLAVVVGTLELVRDDPKAEEWYDLLDNAMEATRQGMDLTRNMLAFSRQAPLTPKVLDLNEVITSSNTWVRRTLPANVALEMSQQEALWPVKVDESSTVSALLNLVVNARDAMSAGGRIDIETSNVELKRGQLGKWGEDLRPGRYVRLKVSDNGSGIAPHQLSDVFEPFFTTKAVGSGTGLGLAMVQGFVKQSGGTVAVQSELGKGTTFNLYFPAVEDESHRDTPAKAPEQARQSTAGARLLVVEDEPTILANLDRALTRLGYKIVTAPSGDAALEIFRKDQAFDLMITDIIMPGTLQGTELVTEVRQIKPDLPVVFMSGYSKDFAELGEGARIQDHLLMKPVKRADLIVAIEQQLDAQRAAVI